MTRGRSAGIVSSLLAAALLAGCGGSSDGNAVTGPSVAPARVFRLSGFEPASTIAPGRPTTVSFTVRMPSGKPLTSYRTGSGPHTGVHLIIVRDDLGYLIHKHPPIGPDGLLRQTVTFPAPGRYRVLVDIYPNIPGGQPNFQLFRNVKVTGRYKPAPLPAFHADQTIDGYRVEMQGHPALHAIQAAFVNVRVLDSHGRKVSFVPWFGARPRDLLPPGIARLFPHPRVRAERAQLRERPRRDARVRPGHGTRKADARGLAPRPRNVAALLCR